MTQRKGLAAAGWLINVSFPVQPNGASERPSNRHSAYTWGVYSLSNIDWSPFLGRPRLASPALEVLDALYDTPILVSGAGGTLGSALAHRMGALSSAGLSLLDSSESRLYKLEQEWRANGTPGTPSLILGTVLNRTLLDELFTMRSPRLIVHTAAFKNVALLEGQPLAAISNNVFGTHTLCRAAAANEARVVLLSTTKAVDPCSIMGATKRLAEQVALAYGGIVLRIGNVLATRDSVTETFASQIANGRPLTVSDPGARRFFLTLDEAVNMLLIASASSQLPIVTVPELPPPQFITDLAQFMAERLAPGRTFEIDFVGLRPGDKDQERLWSSVESPRPLDHPGMLSISTPMTPIDELENGLDALRETVDARDLVGSLEHLQALVPEYVPSANAGTAGYQRTVS